VGQSGPMPSRYASPKDRQDWIRAELSNDRAAAHRKPLSNPETSHRTNHPRRIVRNNAAETAVDRVFRWAVRSFFPDASSFGVAESSRPFTGFRQWSALAHPTLATNRFMRLPTVQHWRTKCQSIEAAIV